MRRLTLLFLLAATGCGSGEKIVVGSKNFTEQIILGEMLAQQIESRSGLAVDRRLNLGGTFICDRALRAGEIDLYVEYTGTAFTAILKQKPISDAEEVYRRVKSEYGRSDLEWLEPLGFNNTFAIIVRGQDARRLNIETISQAARYTPQWKAGFGYEFIERADGFKGLSERYRLQFAERPRVMELDLIYRALASKQVDLIAGDWTNGLITALDLFVLKDDKHYFPPYYAAPVARRDVLDRHPEVRRALEALAGKLSEQQMRQMNYEVDGKRRSAKEVAAEFLKRAQDVRSQRR